MVVYVQSHDTVYNTQNMNKKQAQTRGALSLLFISFNLNNDDSMTCRYCKPISINYCPVIYADPFRVQASALLPLILCNFREIMDRSMVIVKHQNEAESLLESI